MAGGLGNWRMREEPPFLILDGMMTAFASFALTLAHPTAFLPIEYFDKRGAKLFFYVKYKCDSPHREALSQFPSKALY